MMNRRTLIEAVVAAATLPLLNRVASAQASPNTRNVVFVHGLFADGSCWSKVITRLQQKGVNCTSVQNPLTSLHEASEAARRAIAAQPGLTVLVGHSAGNPGNGKPFPDGAKMAKVHWNPRKNQYFPDTTVPGTLDFMMKDSNRFADSGGWGWAAFNYDAASNTFTPGNLADEPPQANDAKCGFACHTLVETRDYVFTEYGKR